MALLLNSEDDLWASYIWEFPTNVNLLGAVSNNEKITFIVNTDSTKLFYTALLGGENDKVLINKNETEEYDIEKIINTKNFLDSSFKKRINRVALNCDFTKRMQLEIMGKSLKERFLLSPNDITAENEVDIILGEFGTKTVALNLKTNGEIIFKSADIFYS